MHKLKPNPIVAAWESGRPAISAWSVMPGKASGEVLALLDFDAVAIDMQHSMFDRDSVSTAITAIQAAGSAAIARIPWNDDAGLVMGLLDYGLAAIICPSVGSPEECRRFVSACRYPPLGIRNSNVTRASGYSRDTEAWFGAARQRELVVAMVETASGLESIEDIAATPGLDVVQLGPGDLILSRFGHPAPAGEAKAYLEAAHRRTIEAARAAGIRAAANAPNAARVRQLAALGYDLIFLGCDLFDMQDHYRSQLAELGDLIAPREALKA